MNLHRVQAEIETRYEVHTDIDIAEFLVTDRACLDRLHEDAPIARGAADNPREMLLVRESSDALDVTLFIDQAILSRLSGANPFDALDAENLDDFLVAVEGVSHFVYLSWNARFDKRITAFELELQAEVDKFLAVLELLETQSAAVSSAAIHTALFERTALGSWVDDAERERYAAANFYAGKYCRQLIDDGLAGNSSGSLLAELRRFYRLPQNDKVRHINVRAPQTH